MDGASVFILFGLGDEMGSFGNLVNVQFRAVPHWYWRAEGTTDSIVTRAYKLMMGKPFRISANWGEMDWGGGGAGFQFVITVAGNAGCMGNLRPAAKWIAPAFRPVQDKLKIWTGAIASQLTGTQGSLAEFGASEAHACRLPRCSTT